VQDILTSSCVGVLGTATLEKMFYAKTFIAVLYMVTSRQNTI